MIKETESKREFYFLTFDCLVEFKTNRLRQVVVEEVGFSRTCLHCHLNQHGVHALWRHTCVPFSTSISPVALRRSYSSSQADAVPVMSDEVLIRLFLLVVLFFLEEAPLSLECSLNQSSRSSSILIPLMLDAADLSPSLSLLNRKTKGLKLRVLKCFDDDDNSH